MMGRLFYAFAMITTANLQTTAEWEGLRKAIDPNQNILAVQGILENLRDLQAASVVVEHDYLDRDWSAEFSSFYSGLFKRFPKLCRRYHFFTEEVRNLLSNASAKDIVAGLTALSEAGKYLGYIVARPVAHAPLGRVVTAAPRSLPNTKVDLLVRSESVVHLLGAPLKVTGIPFTQQDRRVGACAQAAIWMSARHFHSKHSGSPWVSTIDITEAATRPTDQLLSLVVPSGSGGLTVDNMVRALRSIGREPLLYNGSLDRASMRAIWPSAINPVAVIDRYIDSGVPVIVGLTPWANQDQLHAVVAVGHTLRTLDPADQLSAEPTRADFLSCILVNDDQRGAYLRLPIRAANPLGQTPYDSSHILYLIVALPDKVYTPAESAEKVAWDTLRRYASEWPQLKVQFSTNLGTSVQAGDSFVAAINSNNVVARTYLTFGWRYKQRIAYNSCAETLKNEALWHDFSRYVWVTEFGTRDSFNSLDEEQIKVFAHSVIDATSSYFWEGRSIFHAPGFILRWFHDPSAPFGEYTNSLTPILDDLPYKMKIRGSFPI